MAQFFNRICWFPYEIQFFELKDPFTFDHVIMQLKQNLWAQMSVFDWSVRGPRHMVQLGSGDAVSRGSSSLIFAVGSGLLRPADRVGGVGGQSISSATRKLLMSLGRLTRKDKNY
jgi:hypothetical protein